jgi:hypothetical protein
MGQGVVVGKARSGVGGRFASAESRIKGRM